MDETRRRNFTEKAKVSLFFGLAVLVSASCSNFVFRVPTEGMKPTIGTNDAVIVTPFGLGRGEPERFDIVIFQVKASEIGLPFEEEQKFIMRVIGLPGEVIEIKDNRIFVNNVEVAEPFERILDIEDEKKSMAAFKIPEGEYFLLGDNRPQSFDSRYWKRKTIRKDAIVNKIVEIKRDYYK